MTDVDYVPKVGKKTRRELVSIQYLRALAALTVLVTHALQWPIPVENMTLDRTGRLGVEVFFVVSGFIITVIAGDRFSAGRFALNRIVRIVPTYWAATLLVTACALLLPNQFRTTVPTIEGLLKSFFFIPSLSPKAPLLQLGWTLNYEAFFYLIFAAFCFLGSMTRTIVVGLILVALVLVGNTASGLGFLSEFYTSSSLLGFAFGAAVAQLYLRGVLDRLRRGGLVALAVAMPLLVIAYYIPAWDSPVHAPLHVHILLSLAGSAIVMLALCTEMQGRLPSLRICKYLGDASYSIYLFHLFAMGAAWSVAKRLADVTQWPAYLLFALAATAAGLVFSLICYTVIEKPFLAASRRWKQRNSPA